MDLLLLIDLLSMVGLIICNGVGDDVWSYG